MDGLGYGLIERASKIFYHCNYKGYSFEYEAPAEDYQDKTVQREKYTEFNSETGAPTGAPEMIDVIIKEMKNKDQSALNVKDYFDKNIAGTEGLKTWNAGVFGKLGKDVEYYTNESAIKTQYSGKDWTQKDDKGNIKPVAEILGKTIRTAIDGSLIVVK